MRRGELVRKPSRQHTREQGQCHSPPLAAAPPHPAPHFERSRLARLATVCTRWRRLATSAEPLSSLLLSCQVPGDIQPQIDACSWLRRRAAPHVMRLRVDVGQHSWDFLEETIWEFGRDMTFTEEDFEEMDEDFHSPAFNKMKDGMVQEFQDNMTHIGIELEGALQRCTRLTHLQLDDLPPMMDWSWLKRLRRLQSLSISRSDAYTVPLSGLAGMSSLQGAHLKGCDSPGFRLPPSLTKLHWSSTTNLPVSSRPWRSSKYICRYEGDALTMHAFAGQSEGAESSAQSVAGVLL